MLADTDVGSIITAAQSGARWGYKLLLLQLVLIPVLYVCQELTVRLGLITGRGHGELILRNFGFGWAWLSVSTLVVACFGALVTELSGLAGVGLLFGVPVWLTMVMTGAAILAMVLTGSHRSVERNALFLGLFELVFVWVTWRAHPDSRQLLRGLVQAPLGDYDYLYLVTANIGAVIMPWMIFYQQSASVEKGLIAKDLAAARWETATGAVVTQIIMAAVLVATAATVGQTHPNAPLETVQQISETLTPFLGFTAGRIVFAIGMTGSALIATVVVLLTAAWGVGEVAGYRHSLADGPRKAPWFYGLLSLCLLLGAALVSSGIDLVALSVGVQVLNALLLPIVLGFLYVLARRVLPAAYRLQGFYGLLVGVVVAVTAGFGLGAIIWTFVK
jgi:NRAMP (natural resistance-associated macrophage protein)-like metal ion transporter